MNREIGFKARSVVKRGLARVGIDVKRVGSFAQTRPIGVMSAFLSDLHTGAGSGATSCSTSAPTAATGRVSWRRRCFPTRVTC